jgi:hypothetical protein
LATGDVDVLGSIRELRTRPSNSLSRSVATKLLRYARGDARGYHLALRAKS